MDVLKTKNLLMLALQCLVRSVNAKVYGAHESLFGMDLSTTNLPAFVNTCRQYLVLSDIQELWATFCASKEIQRWILIYIAKDHQAQLWPLLSNSQQPQLCFPTMPEHREFPTHSGLCVTAEKFLDEACVGNEALTNAIRPILLTEKEATNYLEYKAEKAISMRTEPTCNEWSWEFDKKKELRHGLSKVMKACVERTRKRKRNNK